jgi:hypothetical protein
MVKLPDLDKWTYSKITTSPKPLVKLPNPINIGVADFFNSDPESQI